MAITDITSKVNNLSVITKIRFDSDLIEALKHITFLYDAGYKTSTLARTKGELSFCFFNVLKCQEIMQTDISSKPMLFYDQQTSSGKEAVSGGAMSIVSDNAVIQPKTYQIEALITDGADNLMIQRLMPYILKTSLHGNKNSFSNLLRLPQLTVASTLATATLTTFAFLYNLSVESLAGLATGTVGKTDISEMSWRVLTPNTNKLSLEAMWKSRRLLKMKLWDSWQYKYGVIKNLTIDKEPTDNNNTYKVTMTFQEMPILTYRDQANTLNITAANVPDKDTEIAIVDTLNAWEG